MISVKILCKCGQKYAFDVEPLDGRMPQAVNCPVCGADGTSSANEIIASSLPPPRPAGLGINRRATTHAAPVASPIIPNTPQINARANKSKTVLWISIGAAFVLLVCAGSGYFMWKKTDNSGPQVKLTTPIDPSYPNTLAELNTWYQEPPEGKNAAVFFLQTFDQLHLKITDADINSKDLPFIGKAPMPGLDKPLPKTMVAAINNFRQQINPADYSKSGEIFSRGMQFESSRYPVDFNLGEDAPMPHLTKLKQLSKLMILMAVWDADKSSGTYPKGVQQGERVSGGVIMTLCFGQSLEQEPALISQLVRENCNSLAVTGWEQILNRASFSSNDLVWFQKAFDRAAAHDAEGIGFTRAIAGERVMSLAVFDLPPDKLQETVKKMSGGDASTLQTMTKNLKSQRAFCEETFNRVLEMRKQPFPERLKIDDYFLSRMAEAKSNQFVLCAMLLPAIGHATSKEASGLAGLHLAQTAIGLEQFRIAHNNNYPDSLSALAPDFLKEIPTDPFDGTPLNYTKRGSGYQLSALGADGKTPVTFTVVKPPKAMAGTAQTAQSAADGQANYLKGIKEQISLPPEITAFITAKEQLVKDIAQKDGFELDTDFKNFFTAAKAGRAREAEQFLLAIEKNSYGTNLTPALKSPLPQVAVDVALAYEAFDKADADLVLSLGNDLMNSLPTNCIYFGGTDVGRGLPTMLCKSPGVPIFVISQNPLADGRYCEYLREMYGARIHMPTTNEFQVVIDSYLADAQRRWQHDQDFPKEPKQLRPGENIRIVDGKPHLDGVAVMGLNAQLAKAIFDKNTGREFYYEQSSPLDWMYPYLSPHGLVLKLNREQLPAISADDIKADTAYWSAKVAQLKSNAKFKGDDYAGKAYAHMRSSIAGLYVWRAQSAKDGDERQRMLQVAEFAFNQALALNPALPDAVYGLVNVEMPQGKLDAALIAVKNALATDPSNAQMKSLFEQLQKYQQQAAANKGVNPNPK